MISDDQLEDVTHSMCRRKRRLLSLGVTAGLLFASASVATAQWFFQNPLPQPNDLEDVDFVDAQTGMAVFDGGVIRTKDGGITWSIGNRVRDQVDLSSLALIDEDTATVAGWVGGQVFNAFIARTDDGGDTWAHQLTGSEFPGVTLLDVFFTDADNGVAVGAELFPLGVPTILRTTDGGTTWSSQEISGLDNAVLYEVFFSDTVTGFAVGTGIDPSTGTQGGIILRTTDQGETWSLQLHDSGSVHLDGIAFMDTSRGVAVGSDGVALTTVDGGESWSHQDTGTDRRLKALSCDDTLRCVVVGGGPGPGRVILRTTDGGESWATQLLEDDGSRLQRVAFVDATALVAVGLGGGDGSGGMILRSADVGVSWERQNPPSLTQMYLYDAAFTDAYTGTVVGDDGTILRTSDGGSTWTPQMSGTALPLLGVSFVDAFNGVAVGGLLGATSDGVILRTSDGGDTWSSLTLESEHGRIALTDVSCVGAGQCMATGYASPGNSQGNHRVILRSEDGGEEWIVQFSESGAGLHAIHCVDQLNCNVVGRNGNNSEESLILQTSDGGETWSRTVTEGAARLRGVFFTDVQTGVAVGWAPSDESEGGVIMRTTDGGATWTTVLQSDERLEGVAFADGESGIAVGSSGVVLETGDGGETWTRDEDTPGLWGSGTVLRSVASPVAGVGTAVGQRGLILRTVGRPTFPLNLDPSGAIACVPTGDAVTVGVVARASSVGGYVGPVDLSSSGEPPGVTSALDPTVLEIPGSSSWTMTVDSNTPAGRHNMTLTADDGMQQQIAHFVLDLVDAVEQPALSLPESGDTEVDVRPTFIWEPIVFVDTYRLQVATDSAFTDLVLDTEVVGTSFTPTADLLPGTQYFWRVQGVGVGDCELIWSEPSSFTTKQLPKIQLSAEGLEFELHVGNGDSAVVTLDNVGTLPLIWSIETAQLPVAVPGPSANARSPRVQSSPRSSVGSNADAVVGLAALEDGRLSSMRPTTAFGGVVDCEGEPGLVIHDDGTVEGAYSADPSGASEVAFADRFTPAAYPASFSGVCVAFVSLGPTSLDFEIVVFDDDGQGGGPGTELGALPVSVDGIPDPDSFPQPVWLSLDISSLGITIDAGSAYIGVRWAPSDPDVFLAFDESTENPPGFAGGYWWTDSVGVWAPIEIAIPSYRSLFVRAVEIPAGCQGPSTLPWLQVTPSAGNTPPGSGTNIEITVDTVGLRVGSYSANLCIHSNDPDRPLVGVPVNLNVIGSELTFDPQGLDFGDVLVDTTSAPLIVALHNGGNLDAAGLGFEIVGSGFDVDTSACGTTLDVGESCQVSVTFAPSEAGPAEGTLTVSSDTGLPVILTLAGDGVRETQVFTPMVMEVDAESVVSDANGVFEPGELVPVAPIWRHDGVAPQSVSGTAFDFTGPEGPIYSLLVVDAEYGQVEPGGFAGCQESEACYEMDIGPAGVPRPVPHWDAAFEETLSDDSSHTWTLHVGDSFTDVPRSSPFYRSIEMLLHNGVTGGCATGEYCPTGGSTRGQMTVFLLKAAEGEDYSPPLCVEGEELFVDVPWGNPLCPWIEELAGRGVTSGCGGDAYCPGRSVTRAQMTVFLLKTLEGPDYVPPECTGAFSDVACSSPFAAWVEELAERGVTGGCSDDPPAYCPAESVTRAQMAVFLARTFELQLYGP